MIRPLFFGFALIASSAFAETPSVFPTPQDALEELSSAVAAQDHDRVLGIFGAEAEDLLRTGDARRDMANRSAMREMLAEGYRFQNRDDHVLLLLGEDGWPFPIPLSKVDGGWQFDIAAGRDEILARTIGLNELDVFELLQAYVVLQLDFRSEDHDGDGVMEFARVILAEPGMRDGLFWPEERGFVGAALARAAAFGWNDGEADRSPEPFSGYIFKILHAQTDNAPGGATEYMIGDNLVAGHAMLAFPAEYAETGVYSFMVSENGIVLEADLGPDTAQTASDITAYDPDERWTPVVE